MKFPPSLFVPTHYSLLRCRCSILSETHSNIRLPWILNFTKIQLPLPGCSLHFLFIIYSILKRVQERTHWQLPNLKTRTKGKYPDTVLIPESVLEILSIPEFLPKSDCSIPPIPKHRIPQILEISEHKMLLISWLASESCY